MTGFRRAFDRTRYALPYLCAGVPESEVQATTLRHLAALGIPAIAVDAGAAKLRGRAWGALKRAGVQDPGAELNGTTGAGIAGLTDIVGCLPGGRALFLEIKRPAQFAPSKASLGRLVVRKEPGAPTTQQIGFLTTMGQAGAVVGIIWGPGDLEEILDGAKMPLNHPETRP